MKYFLLFLILTVGTINAAQQTIGVGTTPNDGTGDTLRAAMVKANSNFTELYTRAFDSDITLWAGITPSANGGSLVSAANYAAMRTLLDLEAGTDFNAYDADLGVIAGLADPNADRILFWDDSAGAYAYLTAGTGLTITGTSIASSGGSGDVATDTIWNVAGDLVYGTGSDTASRLAIGTAGQVLQVNTGATAPEWTSTIDVTTVDATSLEIGGVAVTSTAAEINILDGATMTVTELNYVDGVTSAIQTQLTAKANLAGGNTFTGTQVFPSGQALIAPALGTIASGVGTALTALNGENVQDDTIDDDSLDFGTGADQIDAGDVPIADTGSIFTATTAEAALLELAKVPTKTVTGAYTVGTTDPRELYGGVLYVTSAATVTIPAVAAGASFTVITIGAIAVSVDPNASDLIYLDGTALADGDKVTNTSTAGDIAVFTYYDATGWYCSSNTWTDGN